MKKINFNQNWYFTLDRSIDEFNTYGIDKYSDAAGAAARFYDHCNWEQVELPHDWVLSLPKTPLANTFAGAYPNTRYHRFMGERHSELEGVCSVGWYRKQFTLDPEWEGKRVFIEFEGVFRDAILWVNGTYLDRHASGYTSFALDITDHLVFGEDNSVALRVDCEQPEGWWYEGAGIYRNVKLLIGEPTYFQYHQTVIKTERSGEVKVRAVLTNDTAEAYEKAVTWGIYDGDGRQVAATKSAVSVAPYSDASVGAEMRVEEPHLWSVDTPYLYTLKIQTGNEETEERFGIRTVDFDPDRGFLLNGEPLKVRGACVHQDFGGVGVALTDNLQAYKIKRLKEMGVNAYRCAHHAPAPALLDACDELGMLVMDETRMFGTSPEAIRQLTDLIERDRNHPCVFIWSLGNEEFSVQNTERSSHLMEKATRIAKALDPTRPVTYGGNNGANFRGINQASEVRGVNYIRNDKGGTWLELYHKEHPHQPIIGTEESSYVLSRGGAVNDMEHGLLDATGNVTMPWGSTPKGWVKYMETRDYFAGSFMWTGFDYRGEPNPFYYGNCISSFGTIDLCGMEKPPFYYYRAWWTDEPVLKLAPHWNHKEGERVTVAVFTNCEEITLSLNGRTLERRSVEPFDAPMFEVAYEPGILSVEGKRGGEVLYDELLTSGVTADVRCFPVLEAKNREEIAIYEINAYDAEGVFCPMASEEVALRVEHGRIVGVGNGDPSCFDAERMPDFEEAKQVTCFYENGVAVKVPPKKENALPPRQDWIAYEPKTETYDDDFRLVARYKTSSPQDQVKELVAYLEDVGGYEYVEFERLDGKARVYLNGEEIGNNLRWHGRQARNSIRPYRFYGHFKEGVNELKVVFAYGAFDLPLMSGYVKVGRRVEAPYSVKLHYGKARVFVKSETPERLVLSVRLK